jgi:DNA (cytosine-5)-methyltransferase 1
MTKLKVLDLFSGIGGFSLGLERTGGFETVAFCEQDYYCQQVLMKHWPRTIIYNDIKTLPKLDGVDVVCGGFPCQPHSTASHGLKTAECLWSYMLTSIEAMKPKFAIAENVQEKPMRKAESDLRKIGYDRITVKRISAHDAGADHQRNRWWLIAHPYDESEFCRALNAEVAKLPQVCSGIWDAEAYASAIRVSNGVSDRMDEARLKALGNTVFPFIPQAIGHAILAAEAA